MFELEFLKFLIDAKPHVPRILSLGAGVQSTALVIMAGEGVIPKWDLCVFADTGWEPEFVYSHLRKLASYATSKDMQIVEVKKGNLQDDTFTKRSVSPPLWVLGPDGKGKGPGFRGCTSKYKVEPIEKFLRTYCKVPRGCKEVKLDLGIGISLDEFFRARSSRHPWINHTFPLLELKWSRQYCIEFLIEFGWGGTPKSACVGCPYHSDALWKEIKERSPQDWEAVLEFDEAIRNGTRGQEEPHTFYLHRSYQPLKMIDFTNTAPDLAQVGCSPFACPGDLIMDTM